MVRTKVVLGIKGPEKKCNDKKCPFHGGLGVRKESYVGKVIKKDLFNTATIEWGRQYYVPKYERYEKRRSRLRVHNPECIKAKIGERVLVAKTRKLSKTKNFVILKILK